MIVPVLFLGGYRGAETSSGRSLLLSQAAREVPIIGGARSWLDGPWLSRPYMPVEIAEQHRHKKNMNNSSSGSPHPLRPDFP